MLDFSLSPARSTVPTLSYIYAPNWDDVSFKEKKNLLFCHAFINERWLNCLPHPQLNCPSSSSLRPQLLLKSSSFLWRSMLLQTSGVILSKWDFVIFISQQLLYSWFWTRQDTYLPLFYGILLMSIWWEK